MVVMILIKIGNVLWSKVLLSLHDLNHDEMLGEREWRNKVFI